MTSHDGCVHELFEQQAARTPDAVALECGATRLTYRELDALASAVAAGLVVAGVSSGSFVGISTQRSPSLVIGLIGILKAGAAYVPLDPNYPAERIDLLVRQADVRVALEVHARGVLTLGVAELHGARHATAAQSARSAAYVLFTSGSTGTPKGVCVEHRSIVRLVRGVDWASFAPEDVFLAAAPLAFDASTLEIWAPLLNGGKLVVPPPLFSIEELADLIRSRGITCLWLTSGLFNQIVDHDLDALAGVRQLFAGGDVLSPAHVRRVVTELPSVRMVNGYGPTENTTFTTCHHIVDVREGERIPIGRPITGTTVYILDRDGAQLPVGGVGELFAGGLGVARGYLAAAATAERFLPDPFASEPGARMYRTGDLARWLPDGNIDFLGRADDQVKVRGFRIELGEIEAALMAHVRAAVVVARGDGADKSLIAYVVPARGIAIGELRARLERRLPIHMVPAAYVVLDALPLDANGKVDRKALPAPTEAAYPRASFVAPTTSTELAVTDILRELLGGRQLGTDDNFLALGGHSLLAMRAVSRIRAAFGVELPLRSLFVAKLAQLAAEVDRLRADHRDERGPLVPTSREGPLALSFTQQRLWFLATLDPSSRVYNLPSSHRLRGRLDPSALRRAFERLIDRHEALRTVFPVADGVPHQELLPPSPFVLPIDDVASEREAVRRAEAAALEGFDLQTGPLLRARVLRIADDDHVLLLDMHHIISDGWSMAVIGRELAALYGSFTRGEAPNLPALPVQYADYAVWQRGWLSGETLDLQLAYWKQQLANAPADLALPYANARRAGSTATGRRVELALEPALAAKLHALARQHDATLFMVLVGALRTLLARYCGQRDLCIGTAIANRGHHDLEGLVGFFVNTLVLRGRVDRSDRFVDLLAREQAIALAAYAHQDAPFDLVINALGLERSASRTPLIQVMCIDHGEIEPLALPGLSTEPFLIDLELEPFEIAVESHERDGVRDIVISYDDQLFARETIVALVARYHRLLSAIADQPRALLSQLDLLGPDERSTLFVEPARHVTWEPDAPSVVEQIEHWMAQTPEAPAILWMGDATSYSELDTSTARLAGVLRRRGVGPDRVVIVAAHRGPLQIIGLVAALRAGGAYLPIDPDLPGERIAWMLEDALPAVILCDGPPPAAFAAHAALVVRLDEPEQWLEPPVSRTTVLPDSLAYIIYTSGSTGRPKGVMITRRNFDAQMNWLQREFPLAAGERVLQLLSFTFDGSVWDIFWPLMAGGALVLPRPDGELEPRYLGDLVADTNTTVVHVVPSMMSALVDAIDASTWESVKLILTGGEALSADLARRCEQEFPRAELINVYGPTEVTVTATFCRYREDGKPVAIGGPVDNTTVYVLDDDLAPVPPGGIGELWLGGIQVARGYLQRPMLTAERFVPNPYGARAGERIYKTGDLVRQRTDGILEYVGRSDFQVKVRGFRIELGEIEGVLCEHPSVRTAVVVTGSSGKTLVAYVCMSDAEDLDEVRDFVAERLPDYMVPSAFVVLDQLPLTTSGKLDRNALPEPDQGARRAYDPPQGDVENRLAAIWTDLLQVEQVGRHDNFFTLGGHSLLAIRLIATIRRELTAQLKLNELFESPTLAQMAARLDRREAAQRASVKRLARSEGPTQILQAYYHGVFEGDPQMGPPLVHADLWQFRGALEASAVERAVVEIGTRHEILRTSYAKHGTELQQIVRPAQPPFLPSYEYEDLSADDDAVRERGLAAAIEAFVQPIDLGNGPVLRFKLIRLAPETHALLILIHHIYFDVAFDAIFYRDLDAAYTGTPAAPLPFQFLDVAAYLHAHRDTPAGRADLEYWAKQANGLQPLALPVDFPRDPIDRDRAAMYAVTGQHYVVHSESAVVALHADVPLARAVAAAVRAANVTPLVYFLAGVLQMLYAETGQHDIVLLTALNIRPLLDAEPVLGGFNSPVLIRADFSKPMTREQVLLRVRDTFADAYAHALISPFQSVPSFVGRVNVGFAGASSTVPRLGDAVATPLPAPGRALTPFDLRPVAIFGEDRLTVSITYATSLFRRETIERLCRDCMAVLQSMAEDPQGEP